MLLLLVDIVAEGTWNPPATDTDVDVCADENAVLEPNPPNEVVPVLLVGAAKLNPPEILDDVVEVLLAATPRPVGCTPVE